MKITKYCLLVALGMLLASCTADQEETLHPVNLSLLIDQARIKGDVVVANPASTPAPVWQEVFREDFTPQSWSRWVPAPNQVPPPQEEKHLQERWQQAVDHLGSAARLVENRSGESSGTMLQVEGAFDLQWVGYVVPVSVKGGRNYRVSAKVKAEGVEARDLQRLGFVGFLELDVPLKIQDSYSAAEVAPHILADMKSPGVNDANQGWRNESFALTLHEETETLLLYLCVYHGGGMDAGRVLFDDVLVEELAVQPLESYLAHVYPTTWTSQVDHQRQLFKVAGWGDPTKLSHHLEGLVSAGESRIVFPLDGKKYEAFSFFYGPLREFSTLSEGELSFHVEVNGQQLYEDHYDFSKGEGKLGWRQRLLPLPEGVEELALVTRTSNVTEMPAGFWGVPWLLPTFSKPQRSVLILCIDSLRKDFTRLYGGVNAMPVFDRLAKDGATYDKYLSAGNTTRYALTALLTGEYAGRNGLHLKTVYDVLSSDFRQHFAEQVPTLPGWFRDHGYQTFACVDNPFLLPVPTGLHLGFSEIFNVGFVERAYETTTDLTLDYLERSAAQPFFAFVHYDPDYLNALDHDETPGIEEAQLKAGYFVELEKINAQIERLIDSLRRSGRYETTDILLVSDHGESLDPERTGHGYYLTPDQVVVPLVIKPAGVSLMTPGQRIPGMLSSIDIAPWLTTEHGLMRPDGFVGEAGAVEGKNAPQRTLFSEGLNDHQLLVLQPQGTYLLHRDGREELYAARQNEEALTPLRREALDFLAAARRGLYLDVDKVPSLARMSVELHGGHQAQVIGLQAEDAIDVRKEGVILRFAPGGHGRVLFVPEEAISYPFRALFSSEEGAVSIGIPPSFLPLAQDELVISGSDSLYSLTSPSAPGLAEQGAEVRAWYSDGAGIRTVSASGTLDPAMRSMLKRWGYLK